MGVDVITGQMEQVHLTIPTESYNTFLFSSTWLLLIAKVIVLDIDRRLSVLKSLNIHYIGLILATAL